METADVNRLERATLLTQHFLDGREMTAAEAAELCGVSIRTAQRDLNAMARILAIYRDDGGPWRLLRDDAPA